MYITAEKFKVEKDGIETYRTFYTFTSNWGSNLFQPLRAAVNFQDANSILAKHIVIDIIR